ncbi:hypothetical protein [Streptomyces sp. C]|uniref:hypothetical protein n=1 Tax=Streptomyces sp. C TaxID=253839 RepID=UPI0001B57BE9|nr:hypothetical protein [Streptomyces sp. C]EFL12756.1 conserved hypothetical protein [Streptomyces sp. C]
MSPCHDPDIRLGPRVTVHPPDAQGRRRAHGIGDLMEFLRRAGLDPDNVDLDDTLLIEWRGGGPDVWTLGPGKK